MLKIAKVGWIQQILPFSRHFCAVREAAKKVIFSVAGPQREGGLNGCATKEKELYFDVRKKVPMATKPRGGRAGH